MAYKYFGKNIRPFTSVCDCRFGRKVIKTNQNAITEENIVAELNKALPIHSQNAVEIEYLDNYYRGDQPILYRNKKGNRSDVNNKIVENLAFMLVETKTAELVGEPIQYVLHGKDENKALEIAELNELMDGEDKSFEDIELCRWRSICGTAYRFVGKDDGQGKLLDQSDFYITTENPATTFVVYYNNGRPAFSCQIRTNEQNNQIYNVYTDKQYFVIERDEIIYKGINGSLAIPVVEYPNNARRLSDIEITISITDQLSQMASERANGIEQFVSAWVKFVNCEIDLETYNQMRQEGALVVKSNNGSENKADVDIISNELNQTESQVAVNDLYDKFLEIQGMANRQNSGGGGDTGNAVLLRNGFYLSEKRAELGEPVLKRSERMFLRLILRRLKVKKGFSLEPSDIEIKVSRSKLDNMLTKAEVLQILLACGIDNARAIKTVGLFSDPEQVAIESSDRMKVLYPTEIVDEVVNVNDEQI